MAQDSFVPDSEVQPGTDSFVPEASTASPSRIDQMLARPAARPADEGVHQAKVPFFGDTVTIAPNAPPARPEMRSLSGQGPVGTGERWLREGLALLPGLLAMRGQGQLPQRPQPPILEGPGAPGVVKPTPSIHAPAPSGPSVGSAMVDLAGGRMVSGARLVHALLSKFKGQPAAAPPVNPNAYGPATHPGVSRFGGPTVGHGPAVPGPTPSGIAQPAPPPREVQFPPWQRPDVGIAQPPIERLRPPPAWQQPKAVTITGDTGPTGASAGASGRGPAPAQKPSGSQDLPMTREHRPAGTAHPGTPRDWPARPPADPPPGPATMPGPSGTAGIIAKDSILRQALEIAQQWRNQHNKGF